jgi:hypothetical protein
MSLLPPPAPNRVPFAKSAPSSSALTKSGISPASADPSASSMTMIWPVAAANPHASALPLPLRFCVMIRASGRSRRATAQVSSAEWPSITISSEMPPGSRANTWGRFLASFKAGMTTETLGHEAGKHA